MNKKYILGLIMAFSAMGTAAQSGTSSPYSQFGVGVLSDPSQGFSRGMNGTGLALSRGNIVNALNPASYAAVDSMTMLFDVGLSGQMTNYKEGSTRVNATNANFEYFASSFRLKKNLGASFGVLPYSNIGFEYSSVTYLNQEIGSIAETYKGSGGLHQAYIGVGWRVAKPLSVGFNMGYLWGSIDREVASQSTSTIKSLKKAYSATISNYSLSLGMQWRQRVNTADELTLGAVVGIGHKLGADPACEIINADNNTGESDTTHLVVNNGLQLPMTYGIGIGFDHARKLFVGADVHLEKWGSTSFPAYDTHTHNYALHSNLMKDRLKVNVGADLVPNETSRRLINRIHYRLGAGISTPYYYIKGGNGPKEANISAGFGLPLQNTWNNRSVLNVSAQWCHTSATGFVSENTFRINIGLTFNERWFAKWKID